MFKIVTNFFKGHYKTIFKIGLVLFGLYWVIYVATPAVSMSNEEKKKIDSLNMIIKDIYKEQQKLDSNIDEYNKQIDEVDTHIDEIKGQKTIVKEIYHEEINRAGNYTEPQLDSFFSARYH